MIRDEGVRLLKAACAISLKEDRIGALMQRATNAADSGEIDAAIDSVKKLLEMNPRYVDAAVIEGVLLQHEKGQAPPASKSFTQAVRQDPNHSLALWYVAVEAMGRGNASMAVALLDTAAKGEPGDSFAAVTLAWLLKALGNAGGASKLFAERLQGKSAGLACSTLSNLIVGASESPAQTDRRVSHGETVRCLLDLAGMGPEGRRREHPHRIGRAGVRNSAGSGHGLTDGGACQHLFNPALESYRQRFGECVTGHYAEHFFQTIVRPEAQAVLGRIGLAEVVERAGRADAVADMVEVPAAEYTLGCAAGNSDYPEQKVFIRSFWIDRYPVTHRQWREFQPDYAFAKGQEYHPVVNVDFIQAAMYARWCGKRLPTEQEWEAAARGTEGQQHPWGSARDPSLANCADRKVRATTPVTLHSKGASPCGALDLMGNAQEWVDSWASNRAGPQPLRIAKGGGFVLPLAKMFCWHRNYLAPVTRNAIVGFRCVMDIDRDQSSG